MEIPGKEQIEPKAPEVQTPPVMEVPGAKPEPVRYPIPERPKPETFIGDPKPFDIDGYYADWAKDQPIEKQEEGMNAFAKIGQWFSRPFLAQGYNAAAALNRGLAGFSAHLDAMSDYVAISTGMESEGIFEKAAAVYEENADYWRKRAEKVGSGFIDEIIGEAVGGFVPGIGQFMADVASGLTFPYMDGSVRAYKREDNPFIGGMVDAAKTGTLAAIFKMIGPLKQYLRAPVMGTVFGLQEAESAPKGQKFKAAIKGAVIGAGYSMTSPGGRMGLNEVREAIKPEIERFAKYMQDEVGQIDAFHGSPHKFDKFSEERGSISFEDLPKKRQRKFLKRAEEYADLDPELEDLSQHLKEVDPQDYLVQPNAESMSKADKRIAEKGLSETIDYALSDIPPDAEKGATFISLIEKFQKEGDFERETQMIEAYDRQLREAGRFVQAASLWGKATPQAFIRWANKQLRSVENKYGWADTLFKTKPESFQLSKEEQKFIIQKHREMNELPEDAVSDRADITLEMIDMVANKVPPGIHEMFDAFRYQNMLSSPRTQERNIGYNIGATFGTKPADIATRGAIDYVKSLLTGSEREAYVSDVPVYMKEAINAVPNAARAFMEVMKLSRGVEIGKPELGIEAKTEFERARTKQIPVALTAVQRFMEAADKFNIAIISAGETAANLKRGMSEAEAYQAGLKVAEEYLLRDKLDPTDPRLSVPSSILSSMGKWVEESRKPKYPGLSQLSKWYMPFIKTPINFAIQNIEHSPLGAIRKPSTWSEEVGAKILSGSIVSAVGAMFAAQGQTTWAPPTDPKEKELFYATKRKPYSVRMGDTYIPFWYFGPYAVALALPAAVKYYVQDAKKSLTQDGLEKLIEIITGTAKFLGSQTSTQSLGALFSAASGDIDFKFSNQTGFTVQQVIPGSAFVRYVNTIIDPVYRHPKGFIEGVEANLPFLSQRIEARVSPLTNKEQRRDPINYILPYDVGRPAETEDRMFGAMVPSIRYEARQRYYESKMNEIIKKTSTGELTTEESLNEIKKMTEIDLKSLQMFTKEMKGFSKGR